MRSKTAVLASVWLLGCDAPLHSSDAAVGEPRAASSRDEQWEIIETPNAPARASVQRLTHAQRQSGLRALGAPLVAEVPAEPIRGGYVSAFDPAAVTAEAIEYYMAAAERAAPALVRIIDKDVCSTSDVESWRDDDCTSRAIGVLLDKIQGREASRSEQQRYRDFLNDEIEQAGLARALWITAAAMLQSPYALYSIGFADPDDPSRLSAAAIGDRLSLLLMQRRDGELIRQGREGNLRSLDSIRDAASQILNDPLRSRQAITAFARAWLELQLPADDPRFVQQGVPLAVLEETTRFVGSVLLEGDGRLEALLATDKTWVNAQLAEYYGVKDFPDDPASWLEAQDPTRIGGLLTQRSVLMAHAASGSPLLAPIRRGRFIRRRFLCDLVGDPPPGIPVDDSAVEEGTSLRDQLSSHTSASACAACHQLMDPIGLVYSGYDARGEVQQTDAFGAPVSTEGYVVSDSDLAGAVSGPQDLAKRLAESPQVAQCLARQWFRFAYGRQESESDNALIETLTRNLVASEGNLRDLILDSTTTPIFLAAPEFAQ